MIICSSCEREFNEQSIDGKPIIICPYCGTVRNVEEPAQQEVRKPPGVFGKIAEAFGRIPGWARVVCVSAVSVLLAFVLVLATGWASAGARVTTQPGEPPLLEEDESRIPSVIGELYEDAEAIATEAGLLLIITDKVYSDKLAEDRVLSQDPIPGRILPRGSALRVVISTNVKTIELGIMPDLVFRTQTDAEAMLKEAGILYEIAYQDSDIVQKGNVISQSVKAGEEVNGDTYVILIISNGSKKQEAAVEKEEKADEEDEPQKSGGSDGADKGAGSKGGNGAGGTGTTGGETTGDGGDGGDSGDGGDGGDGGEGDEGDG